MKSPVYFFVISFLFLSCSKEIHIENSAPVIETILADPDSLFQGDTTYLTFIWNDPDGDSIYTSWSARAGSWNPYTMDRWTQRWIAPEIPGEYFLRLKISDTHSQSDTDSIRIVVLDTIGTFIDQRDNHKYKWVKIGKQIWMAENLAYLPKVSGSAVILDTIPMYYVYDYQGNDVLEAKQTGNINKYGALYNWEAAMVSCPFGWHLPSDEEWLVLEKHLGFDDHALNFMGYRHSDVIGLFLKSTHDWMENGIGTNSSGFNALPSGWLTATKQFKNRTKDTYFWASTIYKPEHMVHRGLFYYENGVYRYFIKGKLGFSVRCLKD